MTSAGTAPAAVRGHHDVLAASHWKVGPGTKVGHRRSRRPRAYGVKIAASMGAEVTVLSTSASKEMMRSRLGAHDFRAHHGGDEMARVAGRSTSFSTRSPRLTTSTSYLRLLRADGTLVSSELRRSQLRCLLPISSSDDARSPARGIGGSPRRRRCSITARRTASLRRRGHPRREDQRGLRTRAEERRQVPLRHRSRHVGVSAPGEPAESALQHQLANSQTGPV